MNSNELLEDELISLGKKIRQSPSVSHSVIEQLRDDFCVALPPNRSHKQASRIAKWAVSLSAIAAAVVFMLFQHTDTVAFAQVQKQLTSIRSATFCYALFPLADAAEYSEVSEVKAFVQADGRMRAEYEDGSFVVADRQAGKRMVVDSKKRIATMSRILINQDELNVIETLRSLPEHQRVIKIPTKKVNGVDCPGFLVDKPDLVLRVWVSPRSNLPVHVEFSISERVQVDVGMSAQKERVIARFSDIQFNVAMEDRRFDLTPPVDFVTIEDLEPKVDLTKIFPTTPNIEFLKGSGPITLGMTKAKAIELLGLPDREDVIAPPLPFSKVDDVDQVDDMPRPSKHARLVMLTEYHSLSYFNLGLRLDFEVQEGLVGISFSKQVQLSDGIDFPGLLPQGIGLGSSEQHVIDTYGRPSWVRGADKKMMWYEKLGLRIQLSQQREVIAIQLEKPGEKRYRFEWRMP
jgi:outer membrane lipoprotein-sorting protein